MKVLMMCLLGCGRASFASESWSIFWITYHLQIFWNSNPSESYKKEKEGNTDKHYHCSSYSTGSSYWSSDICVQEKIHESTCWWDHLRSFSSRITELFDLNQLRGANCSHNNPDQIIRSILPTNYIKHIKQYVGSSIS